MVFTDGGKLKNARFKLAGLGCGDVLTKTQPGNTTITNTRRLEVDFFKSPEFFRKKHWDDKDYNRVFIENQKNQRKIKPTVSYKF